MTEKRTPFSKKLIGFHVALMVTGIISMFIQFTQVLIQPDAKYAEYYHATWGGGFAIVTGFIYGMIGKVRHVCRCVTSIAMCVITILAAIGMAVLAGLGAAEDAPNFNHLQIQVISNALLIACGAVIIFVSIATMWMCSKSISMTRLSASQS